MQYDDFVIQLEPGADRHYSARVLQSPAGEGQSRFELPFETDELDRILTIIDQRSGPGKREVSPTSSRALVTPQLTAQFDPADVGQRLFDSLFSGQVGTLYHQSLGIVGSDADRGLRIKLKLQSGTERLAALEMLPWEMLCRADTRDFLGLSRLTPIVRYLDVPRPIQSIPLPDAILRILVVISSPSGLPPLDLETEKKNLEEIWQRQKSVQPVFLERATVAAMREALFEQAFHAIHFMGHGGFDARTGEGVLYFENEEGGEEALSGGDLATKLKDFKSLGLIFLNACQTARAAASEEAPSFSGVASALVLGGLPAVVAMQFPISDRAAIELSGAFYHRMAAGISVDEALTEGRQAIHTALRGSMEWATPVLFVRVPDGKVFKTVSKEKPALYKRWWAVLPVLVLLLGLAALPGIQEQFGWSKPGYEIQINQALGSNVPGLSGRVTKIVLTAQGRMRVFFEVTNHSDGVQEVGFDRERTYMADERGNEYPVLGTDTAEISDVQVVHEIERGGSIERWLEFDAPMDQARSFKFALASHDAKQPSFKMVPIELEAYPPEFSKKSPEKEAPEGARRLPFEAITLDSQVEGMKATISEAYVMTDRNVMRWNLEIFNQSDDHQTIEIDWENSHVVDDQGKEYRILNWDTMSSLSTGWHLPGAVRKDHWLEFGLPTTTARKFKIVLKTRDGRFGFSREAIEINGYEPEPAPDKEEAPPPTAITEPELGFLKKAIPFKTNVGNLTGKLTGIERRGDRMRWSFSLHNGTPKDLRIGINYRETYLADEHGHPYKVRASDTGINVDKGAEGLLPAGATSRQWLEFEAPRDGARNFRTVLVSHDPKGLSYQAFKIGPVSFPGGFGTTTRSEALPDATHLLVLDQALVTGVDGVDGRLTRVALMKHGQMRWFFDLFNRSEKDVVLRIDYGEVVLEDEYGNTYKIQGSDVQKTAGVHGEDVRRFLRVEHWIDFSAPVDGARSFTFESPAAESQEIELLRKIEVELPEYPRSFTKMTVPSKPIENFELKSGETLIDTSVAGVQGKLTGVDRLENGRLRWYFEFVNRSSETVVYGFDHQATYLSADTGHRYKLLQADTNPNPSVNQKPFRGPLAPGTQVNHWFEFSAPVNATKFICVIASYDSSKIRFFPFEAEVPD